MPGPRKKQEPVYGPEIRDALLEAIRASGGPMKPAEIGKCVRGRKVSGPAALKVLSGDLDAGLIFKWGSAYWHSPPEKVAEERLAKFAGAELLVEAVLLKRALAETPKLGLPALRRAKARLVEEKRFRLEGPKGEKIVVDTQHPEPFLEREISRLLESFGRVPSAEKIRALLMGGEEKERPVENRNQVQEVAQQMFDAMRRIAFSTDATVTFYRLRQQPELAHIPKAIFDAAALLLESQRKALLSIHDHAAALPLEERERFVTDGLGAYYVSIYAR